jgi:integral membrane protein
MAFVTGVILGVMTLAMIWVYAAGIPESDRPGWYGFGWIAHGWLYIVYVATTLDLVFRLKWHVGKALLIMIAGTVPFMSFVAERYVTRRVDPLIAKNIDLPG